MCTNDGREVFTRGGTERNLKCEFDGRPSVQNVSWFKDNKLVLNGTDGLYQIEEQTGDGKFHSTLNFFTVRMEHAGSYTCKANEGGNSSCRKITVEVRCKCGLLRGFELFK